MATSGCDFICENEECEHAAKGIVVIGPWPLGEIEYILEHANIKHNKDYQNQLNELLKEDRKYSCIPMPNNTDIAVIGYRLQKWCQNCPCLWTYDLLLEDPNETLEETIAMGVEQGLVKEKCPKCENHLIEHKKGKVRRFWCPYCCCYKSLEQPLDTWFK